MLDEARQSIAPGLRAGKCVHAVALQTPDNRVRETKNTRNKANYAQ